MDKFNPRIAHPTDKGPQDFHPIMAMRDDVAKSGPLYFKTNVGSFDVLLEVSARHIRVSVSREGEAHYVACWHNEQWGGSGSECWAIDGAMSVLSAPGQAFCAWAQSVLNIHKIDLRQLMYIGSMLKTGGK